MPLTTKTHRTINLGSVTEGVTKRCPIAAAALILNAAQAEAIYSAMCALNNVGATLTETLIPVGHGTFIVVSGHSFGGVGIASRAGHERYASQDDFAIAYRINGSAALLADALAQPAGAAPVGFLDEEPPAIVAPLTRINPQQAYCLLDDGMGNLAPVPAAARAAARYHATTGVAS